ncbi:hypothetical protein TB2_021803 [Malus domestica]
MAQSESPSSDSLSDPSLSQNVSFSRLNDQAAEFVPNRTPIALTSAPATPPAAVGQVHVYPPLQPSSPFYVSIQIVPPSPLPHVVPGLVHHHHHLPVQYHHHHQYHYSGLENQEVAVQQKQKHQHHQQQLGEQSQVKPKEYVLTLDNSNFDDTDSKHDFIIVEFYASWCGQCNKLVPEFEKVVSILSKNDPPVILSKVHANEEANKGLGSDYEVKGC